MRFDEEEDNLLRQLIEEIGCKWFRITNIFNDKRPTKKIYTPSMLRNRYYRITKQYHKAARNVCSQCGSFTRGHTCRKEPYKKVIVVMKHFDTDSNIQTVCATDAGERLPLMEHEIVQLDVIHNKNSVEQNIVEESFEEYTVSQVAQMLEEYYQA